MKKNYKAALITMLLMTMALVGCGTNGEVQTNAPAQEQAQTEQAKPEQAKSEPKEQAVVTVGLAKTVGGVPIFIAEDKGYFAEENIKIEYKWFDAANPINVAVASNRLDVGGSGLTADLYNMVAAGQKVVIAADKGREEKGYQLSAVVIHKDSPIQSVEDLKGKKIGVTTIGSSNHYMIGRILEKHGLSVQDVQLVPLNSMTSQLEALKGRNVDAAVLITTGITKALEDGFGKVLVNVADEIDYQSVGLVMSPEFMSNQDVVVRFLKGYIKGARDFYDEALTQKDGKVVPGPNFDEVVKLVNKYTGNPEEIIKKSFSYIDPNGKLIVDDIQEQINWYVKEKLLTKPLDAKEIVNTQPLEEALKQLEAGK